MKTGFKIFFTILYITLAIVMLPVGLFSGAIHYLDFAYDKLKDFWKED